MEHGITMHVRLIQGRDKDSLFIDKHHIITDGTSEELFYKELATLYKGERTEVNKYHYKDYSHWINNLDLRSEKKWWFDYLAGYQRLEIATDYRIQKNKPTVGKTKVIPFKKELLCKIRDFSKENKVSDYVLIFTTISMLLSKMYKSKDFVVGTVANGRVHEAAENMLGMFVNTLPVRVSVDTDQSARQFLNMMNENILSTLSNQNYQFENIAKDLDAANEGRNPFFDCMFVYQNTRYQDYFEGLAKKNPYKTTAAKFSLTFEIEDSGHSMDLFLNYDSSLFKQSTIDRLCKNFFTLLENYLVSNQETISELSALSKEDKNLLLNFDTLSKHGNVIKLIEEQVDKTPDNIALQFGECSLTYSELDNEINKLANYLITKRNVKIEQKIPLLLQRSEKMVIAILGVLKAGAAYVPISP
ncbi:MAG: condensation domain-containing protein, partial [Enterococcus sp.]|nr:condensation domain-containing protein [Enterococcus sp.]